MDDSEKRFAVLNVFIDLENHEVNIQYIINAIKMIKGVHDAKPDTSFTRLFREFMFYMKEFTDTAHAQEGEWLKIKEILTKRFNEKTGNKVLPF